MGGNLPFKNPNQKVDAIEVVEVADNAATIAVEGAEIAAEVISWRGLASTDTRTSRPRLVYLHTSVFTSDTSVVYSKPEASNTITSLLISGDWGFARTCRIWKESLSLLGRLSLENIYAARPSV